MKKSQVALFIIIGMVVLVTVSSILIISSNEKREGILDNSLADLESDAEVVRSFASDCLDTVSTEGAYKLASYGGNYPLPSDYTQLGSYFAIHSYMYSDGSQNKVPTRSELEDNFEHYINDAMPLCFDSNTFTELGIRVNFTDFKAEVKVFDEKVLVLSNYTISIQQEDKIKTIDELHSVEIPVRLGTLNDAAKQIVDWTIQDTGLIPTGFIHALMMNIGGGAKAQVGGKDNTTIYVLYDPTSSISGATTITGRYEYVFGADFT